MTTKSSQNAINNSFHENQKIHRDDYLKKSVKRSILFAKLRRPLQRASISRRAEISPPVRIRFQPSRRQDDKRRGSSGSLRVALSKRHEASAKRLSRSGDDTRASKRFETRRGGHKGRPFAAEDHHVGRGRLARHVGQLLGRHPRFRLRLHGIAEQPSRWIRRDPRIRWQGRHFGLRWHWTLRHC